MISKDDIEQQWRTWDAEGRRIKDVYTPVRQMGAIYASASPSDQAALREIITSWIGSDVPGRDYDAIWLVRELQITEAIPALLESRRCLLGELASLQGSDAKEKRVHIESRIRVLDKVSAELASHERG